MRATLPSPRSQKDSQTARPGSPWQCGRVPHPAGSCMAPPGHLYHPRLDPHPTIFLMLLLGTLMFVASLTMVLPRILAILLCTWLVKPLFISFRESLRHLCYFHANEGYAIPLETCPFTIISTSNCFLMLQTHSFGLLRMLTFMNCITMLSLSRAFWKYYCQMIGVV